MEYRGLSNVRNKGGMIGMLGNAQVRMETCVQRVQRKGNPRQEEGLRTTFERVRDNRADVCLCPMKLFKGASIPWRNL